jgi:anti-anti-sigma factor
MALFYEDPVLLGTEAIPPNSIEVEYRPLSAPKYAAVVVMCGEHDVATSAELAAALAPLSGDILVDLSECDFIDSSIIGVVLAKSNVLEREGHELALRTPHASDSMVTRVIDIIGLRQILTVNDAPPGSAPGDEDLAAG